MRPISAFLASILISTSAFAGDSPKKLCFHTQVSVPIAEWLTADIAKLAAEKQLVGCTDYLKKFKERKKPNASEIDKQLAALAVRSKAYTIMGKKDEAAADIAHMRAIAAQVGYDAKLEAEYGGVGLLIEVMEAIVSDDTVPRVEAMAAEHPYNEALQQIALSYALERGDFLAAANYASLSDKLNESSTAAQLKGYLLELADQKDMALRHYQNSGPSIESYIREAHIRLQRGDYDGSKGAYMQAITIADEGKPLPQNLIGLLMADDDRGKTITPTLKKRLDVLKKIYEIEESGPDAVFQELFQQSTQFGHFELISAMQFVASKMEKAPQQVLALNSKPQLPEGFTPIKHRNSWINKLPRHVPKGKPKERHGPKYKSTIPILTTMGFSSQSNEDGTISVTFESSADTDMPTITELALLGAAKTTLKNNHRFFRIKDLNKFSRGPSFGDANSYLVKMMIIPLDQSVALEKDFDAQKVKDDLAPQYDN